MAQQLRLIKLPAVEEKVGQKRAWIYRKAKNGEFPKQVEIGPGAVAWVESEIDEWILARIKDRDASANTKR